MGAKWEGWIGTCLIGRGGGASKFHMDKKPWCEETEPFILTI